MSPPSRISPSLSASCNRVRSPYGDDVDVDNNHNLSIDPNHQGDKIETTPRPRVLSSPAASAISSFCSTASRLRSTTHRAKSLSPVPHHEQSPSQTRVGSRVPHAFAQLSAKRYFPYIPISITVRQKVEYHRDSDIEEKEKEENTVSDPVIRLDGNASCEGDEM